MLGWTALALRGRCELLVVIDKGPVEIWDGREGTTDVNVMDGLVFRSSIFRCGAVREGWFKYLI